MTIPYTTMKEVFSFDDDDKRSKAQRLVEEFNSHPLPGDMMYFNMTIREMHCPATSSHVNNRFY